MASIQGGSVVKSTSYAELSPSEQAAARKALAGLGVHDLLHGNGSDTFAGGAVQPGSFVAAFASDSVHGGNVFASGRATGLASSSDPFAIAGPTAQGLTEKAQAASGQVVTFSDQTTLNLVGIHHHGGHT